MNAPTTPRSDTIGRLNVSLPESLIEELRQLAKANDRPTSREVRRALEAHLESERAA